MTQHKTVLLAGLALAGSICCHGRALDWGCALYAENVTSDEVTALDGAYVFYLGVFDEGFTPTSANVSDWATNWTTVDAVNYNPDYQIFNARHITAATDPAARTKGYIWGIRRDDTLSEWVLISDPSWNWPENALFGMKETWMVSEASEAIIGAINTGSFDIVTENVGNAPRPAIQYAIWAKRFFADGDPNASEDADPDGNGRVNALDFALDDNPVARDTDTPIHSGIFEIVQNAGETSLSEGGERYLAVIIRPSIDANVTFSGTVAEDPGFSQNAQAAVVEELGDGTLLIRDSQPIDGMASSKFIRVNVE